MAKSYEIKLNLYVMLNILKGLIFVFLYEQKYALIFCYLVFTFIIVFILSGVQEI